MVVGFVPEPEFLAFFLGRVDHDREAVGILSLRLLELDNAPERNNMQRIDKIVPVFERIRLEFIKQERSSIIPLSDAEPTPLAEGLLKFQREQLRKLRKRG